MFYRKALRRPCHVVHCPTFIPETMLTLRHSCHGLVLLSKFSSRGIKSSLATTTSDKIRKKGEVLTHFIPPAYRKRESIDSNRSRPSGMTFLKRKSNTMRSNRNRFDHSIGTRPSIKSKSTEYQHNMKPHRSIRHEANQEILKNQNSPGPDEESLQRLEKDLCKKLQEYNSQLLLKSDLVFSAIAEKNYARNDNQNDDNASSPPASVFKGDKNEDSDVRFNDRPNFHDLYATEELFSSIVRDFKVIIQTYCRLAKTICAAQRNENHQIDKMIDLSALINNQSEQYHTNVLRAQRHLEASEIFYRDREDLVNRVKKSLESTAKRKENDSQLINQQGLSRITSFLGGFLTSKLSSSDTINEDNESSKPAKDSKTMVNEMAQGLHDITASTFDELIVAHKNIDLYPDASTYVQLLSVNRSAFNFGNDVIYDAVERSNRLLDRWISLHVLHSKKNVVPGSEVEYMCTIGNSILNDDDSKQDSEHLGRKIFHTVMRQNSFLFDICGSQNTESWLRKMLSLKKSGYENYGPDILSYNIVLQGFGNVYKRRITQDPGYSPKKNRMIKNVNRYVLKGVEKILMELIENASSDGIYPNLLSLNLALQAIAKASRNKCRGNTCEKVDEILCKMLGRDSFNRLIAFTEMKGECSSRALETGSEGELEQDSDDECPWPPIVPNSSTYHSLIQIYCESNDILYLRRSLRLLKKMIEMSDENQSHAKDIKEDHAPCDIVPSTATYNRVLRAFLVNLSKSKPGTPIQNVKIEAFDNNDSEKLSALEIANEITPLIDCMVQFDASMPIRITFTYIMSIWTMTNTPRAGDHAEELLSRMEIISMYRPDFKPFLSEYLNAIKCWRVSARAGRKDALQRAYRLSEIMEAQLVHFATDQITSAASKELTDDRKEYSDLCKHCYALILQLCVISSEKDLDPSAVKIAFEIHDKMLLRGIQPTVSTYRKMYITTKRNMKKKSKKDYSEQIEKIFALARKYGIPRDEVIQPLQVK